MGDDARVPAAALLRRPGPDSAEGAAGEVVDAAGIRSTPGPPSSRIPSSFSTATPCPSAGCPSRSTSCTGTAICSSSTSRTSWRPCPAGSTSWSRRWSGCAASWTFRDLSPLHRLDRVTAGVLMFSLRPEQRGAYQQLFAHRKVTKYYEAVAPYRADLPAATTVRSRIVKERGTPTADEVPGEPNSTTRIELLDVRGDGRSVRPAPGHWQDPSTADPSVLARCADPRRQLLPEAARPVALRLLVAIAVGRQVGDVHRSVHRAAPAFREPPGVRGLAVGS